MKTQISSFPQTTFDKFVWLLKLSFTIYDVSKNAVQIWKIVAIKHIKISKRDCVGISRVRDCLIASVLLFSYPGR